MARAEVHPAGLVDGPGCSSKQRPAAFLVAQVIAIAPGHFRKATTTFKILVPMRSRNGVSSPGLRNAAPPASAVAPGEKRFRECMRTPSWSLDLVYVMQTNTRQTAYAEKRHKSNH